MSSRIHSDDNFNYTYDGQDVLREDRLGSITTYQNGPGIDNKISQNNWAGTQYFIQDHLGSTTGLADANGDLLRFLILIDLQDGGAGDGVGFEGYEGFVGLVERKCPD